MAQDSLNIKVGLDTKTVKKDTKELQKDMKTQGAKLAKSFNNPNRQLDLMKAKLVKVGQQGKKNAEQMKRRFDGVGASVQNVTSKIQKGGSKAFGSVAQGAAGLGVALVGTTKLAGKLGSSFLDMGEDADTGVKKAKSKLDKFKQRAKTIGSGIARTAKTALSVVKVAAVAAAAGVLGLKKTLEALTTMQSEKAQARILGASTKEAEMLNKQLKGALSQREALQQVASFKAVGFSKDEIQRGAKLVKVYEVLGLKSKDAALEMVKSGNVSESVLNKLGLTSGYVEEQIKAWEQSTGQIPTNLDKARITMGLVEKASKGIRKEIDKIETTSSVDRLVSKFKDLKDKTFKKFAEMVDRNSKTFDKIAETVPKIASAIIKMGGVFIDVLKKLSNSETFQLLMRGFDIAAKIIKKKLEGVGVNFGLDANERKKIGDEFKKISEKLHGKEEDLAKKAENKQRRRNKRASKDRQEAYDDLIGKQSELRNQLRNFTQFFLNNLSTIGGSLAGIISASKDIPEQIRILSSLDYGASAINKTIGLTKTHILQLEKAGMLTQKETKVALLANQITKAGLNDLDEKLLNQEGITAELLSQVTGNERLAQIAAINKSLKEKEIENDKSQKVLRSSLEAIDRRRLELQSKITKFGEKSKTGKRLKSQKLTLDLLYNRFFGANELLKTQEKLQKKILNEQKRRLQFTHELIRPIEKAIERSSQQLSMEKEHLELSKQKEANERKIEPLRNAVIESRLKEVELSNRLKSLDVERLKNARDLTTELLVGTDKGFQEKIKQGQLIEDRITKTKELLSLQRSLTADAEKETTFLGRFKSGFLGAFKSIKSAWRDTAFSFGESIRDALTGGMELFKHFGAAITEALTGIGKGDWLKNMGAGFLDLLAGISAKFGAVFASIGAGYLAMGNPLGAAVLAASAGLFALAGGLSAASSIVSDTGSSSSTGSSSVSSPSAPPPSVAAPIDRDRERREVFVIINGTPWDNAQDQARSYARWHKKNRRIIGEVMP